MNNLVQYVVDHTIRNACRCGECIDSDVVKNEHVTKNEHTVNMYFFDVCATNNPTKEEFITNINHFKNEFVDMNPLEGEHSYIEVGEWIGDQGLGMQFMALGKILGCWKIMHPGIILDLNNPEQKTIADQMAKMGMVSIIPVNINH